MTRDKTLDPSAVKAGDTVTVQVITADQQKFHLTGEVRNVGASLWVGPICIDLPADDIERVTLTDHQPAPKPEWKPGTSGTASVRLMGPFSTVETAEVVNGPAILGENETVTVWAAGRGFIHSQGGDVVSFVPDETRPLPTRDEIRQTAFDAYRRTPWGADAFYAVADSILTLLEGESR
jgi:hypothetical protein